MSSKKQQSQVNQFHRIVKYCKAIPDTVNISELNERITRLRELFAEFQGNQDQLEELCGEEMIEAQFTQRAQIEDYFYFCIARMNEAIEILKNRQRQENNNSQQNDGNSRMQQEVKLPRIEMPTFSGSYEDWTSFKDLFITLIHDNKTISDVQKFHYLKTNVEEPAKSLLKGIPVTAANYAIAWNKLLGRYNHKRYIVDSLLKCFFNQPSVTSESHSQIKALIDKSTEVAEGLKIQGMPVNQWDAILVYVIVSKLDPETHKQWELKLKKDELPTFTALAEFLEARWQSLEMIEDNNFAGNQQHLESSLTETTKRTPSSSAQNQILKKCVYCSNNEHLISSCPKYLMLELEGRIDVIKSKNLCFNCLKVGHNINKCNSKRMCQHCGLKHHTSIHSDKKVGVATNHSNQNSAANGTVRTSELISSPRKVVLLATATINVYATSGELFTVKALVDGGSENAIIRSSLTKRLGLHHTPDYSTIRGIGNVPVTSDTTLVNFRIGSCTNTSFSLDVQAISMQKITGDLPSVSIKRKPWPHLQALKLADPTFDLPSQIDILLGAEVYEQILLEGIIPKIDESPTAQNSKLGWLLFGAVKSKSRSEMISKSNGCHMVRAATEDNLDQLLRKFWEVEDITEQRNLTVKENQAEELYKKTVTRNREGRYIVSLPFDPSKNHLLLGDSKPAAISTLHQLERRFEKNQLLKERYTDYINNLLASDHIEPVPHARLNMPKYQVFYLPHHAVFKESSTTTKLRVVFNASRKSHSGVSLNDKLLVGPKVQDDLYSILVRWRMHKFVFLADAEKMFRQIILEQDQRDFQRLVWRFNQNEPIKEYRITRVIDGTASASFLATRTLQQLAMDEEKKFPIAAKTVKKDFYMDDVSSGSHSIKSTIQLQKDLNILMKRGGFHLRKWLSNDRRVLENIPTEDRQDSSTLVELMEKSVKTLGVYWNPKNDCFEFKISSPTSNSQLTKRQLLSEISKLFDPIGWLAPTTVIAKILMQSLWSLKNLGWDDKVPKDKLNLWRSYQHELKSLEKLKIPRWIGTNEAYDVQLHGFGDAANPAYAAVVYARVVLSDGSIEVHNISAKTKVSPVKVLTIPKLELCGAVMLSKLMLKVNKSFDFKSVKTFYYSDSTITLAWLKSHPNHWNTFVANRVTEIQTITNPENWYFVDTNNNPADCASRGVSPSQLREHPLWWKGPSWLSKSESEWPAQPCNYTTDEETRKLVVHIAHVRNEKLDDCLVLALKKHSNLSQLLRRTARVLRFHPKATYQGTINGHVTTSELRQALNGWIKFIQAVSFPEGVERCSSKHELPNKSKLLHLRPFIDEKGLLRVGGRISKSELPFRAKHPIILPKYDHLTKLIIEQAHQLTLHGGPTLMSSFLSNYWIFGKEDQIKRTIRQCVTCFPYRAKAETQIMADLPKSRVTPNRTFLHCGTDLAGPFVTKTFSGRTRGKFANPTTKSYVCIFICLVTKAIHIELVSDMTSKAFKAAFDRFTSRRGKVSDMYSDCGTNFEAADKELRLHFVTLMKDEELQGHLARDGTTWHFNPPASPHFGGLWEAGVKSIKYHLKRLAGNCIFTFEEMTTLLCKIEACLNSRPLCPMSDDINDVSYLTPGHFTIGEAPIVTPEESYLESNVNRLSRWQLIQRTVQQFWKVWSSEYLSRMQQRPKWNHAEENVREGQLVLLLEDNIPPAKWPVARVVKVHPGTDNKVRVVTIEKHSVRIDPPYPNDFKDYLEKMKTYKSILERPIKKIAILPIKDNESEELRSHLVRSEPSAQSLNN